MGKNRFLNGLTDALWSGLAGIVGSGPALGLFLSGAQPQKAFPASYPSSYVSQMDDSQIMQAENYNISGSVQDILSDQNLEGIVQLIDANTDTVVDTTSVTDGNYTFNTTSVVGDNTTIPVDFAMYSNFPNPFNPSTNIPIDVARNTDINVKIFNVLGQTVADLNDNLSPGKYNINWDPSGSLGDGTYLVKIEMGNMSFVQKMLYQKHNGGGTGGGITINTGGSGGSGESAVAPLGFDKVVDMGVLVGYSSKDNSSSEQVSLEKTALSGNYKLKFVSKDSTHYNFTSDIFFLNEGDALTYNFKSFERETIEETDIDMLEFVSAYKRVGTIQWPNYPINAFLDSTNAPTGYVDVIKESLDDWNESVAKFKPGFVFTNYDSVDSNPEEGINFEYIPNLTGGDQSRIDAWYDPYGLRQPKHGNVKLSADFDDLSTQSARNSLYYLAAHGFGHASSAYDHPDLNLGEKSSQIIGKTIMSGAERVTDLDGKSTAIIHSLDHKTRWENYSRE